MEFQYHIGIFQIHYIEVIDQRVVSHHHAQSSDPLSTIHVVPVYYCYVKPLEFLHGNVSPRDKCCCYEVVGGPTIN